MGTVISTRFPTCRQNSAGKSHCGEPCSSVAGQSREPPPLLAGRRSTTTKSCAATATDLVSHVRKLGTGTCAKWARTSCPSLERGQWEYSTPARLELEGRWRGRFRLHHGRWCGRRTSIGCGPPSARGLPYVEWRDGSEWVGWAPATRRLRGARAEKLSAEQKWVYVKADATSRRDELTQVRGRARRRR